MGGGDTVLDRGGDTALDGGGDTALDWVVIQR